MKNKIFLDVRTPQEFEEVHLRDSFLIPLDKIGNFIEPLQDLKETIVIVCRSGARAHFAQKILAQANITNTEVLEGGIINLNPNEYPLEKGMKKIGI
ncbi:MAG TPA: rhodanese-like domain-containing protein [Candidatus Nanoarchaeia archaeon]|nr:rhodanese-like domain-containing protein [Candidatus Nanoarchaeia archaeon]